MTEESELWLSIVIPAYNAQEFLPECLVSIIKNDIKGVEVIIIDDGSKDSTLYLANKWHRNYKQIRIIHTENEGPSMARKVGLKAAKGVWCWFVDSDDVVLPNSISRLHSVLPNVHSDVINVGFIPFTHYQDIINASDQIFELENISIPSFLFGLYNGKYQHFISTYLFKTVALKHSETRINNGTICVPVFVTNLTLYEDVVGIEGLLRRMKSIDVLSGPLYGHRENSYSLTQTPNIESAESGLRAVQTIAHFPTLPFLRDDKTRMEIGLLFFAYKLIPLGYHQKFLREEFKHEISIRIRKIGVANLTRKMMIWYLFLLSGLLDVLIPLRNYCMNSNKQILGFNRKNGIDLR